MSARWKRFAAETAEIIIVMLCACALIAMGFIAGFGVGLRVV